jgi:hypothetical protein
MHAPRVFAVDRPLLVAVGKRRHDPGRKHRHRRRDFDDPGELAFIRR